MLSRDIGFPPASEADSNGIVAVGGDLRPKRLLMAYRSGIFPWPHPDFPLLWFSPDPRMILPVEDLHIPRSLAKVIRRHPFRITLDSAFRSVICGCAQTLRPDGQGTWITPRMVDAYTELHRLGFAHSVEAWLGEDLVGGLYGVSLGAAFFGESMFSVVPNSSKIGFVTLVQLLSKRGFHFVDCQVHTQHLERFGAQEWDRQRFLDALEDALAIPSWLGKWELGI